MTDLPATAPKPRLFTDRIEHWAGIQPDATCITYEGATYTWAQWRERVHRVSGGLQALGIRRGDRVATVDMNSLSCVELSNGASAIGVAHVIVNFRTFGDQLAYILADSAPRVVFAGAEFVEAIEAVRSQVPSLEKVIVVGGNADEYEQWLADSEPMGPADDVEEDETALVMYSSGTTGFPKGVELTHRNLNAHSENLNPKFQLAPGTTSLAAMPLFHVGGSSYVALSMYSGASTVLLREPDPTKILGAIAQGATRLFLVPAVVAGVLAAGEQATAIFGKLEVFAYGASPMPLPLLERALKTWPNLDFVQVYGMTEMAGVITTLSPQAHRDSAHPERLTSAGQPINGAEIRVVDPANLTDVPKGGSGELWFRTDQTMKGYLGKPEATDNTITTDGWIRTGDLGRLDDGGFVYVLDRLKDMIISGGENIYSPEVENAIAAHPGVVEVAVFAIPHPKWGEAVHAVVVAAPDHELDAAQVIAFARGRLASYQCPKSVEVIDALPRNPSGKILKRELRAPHWADQGRTVV